MFRDKSIETKHLENTMSKREINIGIDFKGLGVNIYYRGFDY